MYLYLPIEHKAGAFGPGQRGAFGLRVLESGAEEDRELMVLPEVSTDFAFTLRLASLFTRKQLSPFRLLEVLEEIL